ncbi:MAG: isopentenyl-diphosphate Delta-isomerase [Hyphomicrobium sp.]|jgi:isopentenyl-diphosphate delta-isomerase
MNDAQERVILVDAEDRPLGTAPKLDVHRRGELHRAFSILVHDGTGRVLLQKRNKGKYHSGGLWTNACCGHPRPGEDITAAASRRLSEEMGFSCPLALRRRLIYRAEVGGGLTEHELVHLFVGTWDGDVVPDPGEAEAHEWRSFQSLSSELVQHPHRFTAWFPLYIGDLGGIASSA